MKSQKLPKLSDAEDDVLTKMGRRRHWALVKEARRAHKDLQATRARNLANGGAPRLVKKHTPEGE